MATLSPDLPAAVTVADAVPPLPSASRTRSPGRRRWTWAAWWPSGPPSSYAPPSGITGTKNSGGLTGRPPPLGLRVAVERVAHAREEAALLGQFGDLLAPYRRELAQHALLIGVELRRRAHVEVDEQVAAAGSAQVRNAPRLHLDRR